YREHRWAQLYAGQLRLLWIEGQVATGATRQLEHTAASLRADPCSAVAEQDALEQGDLPVITVRLLVRDATDALGFVWSNRCGVAWRAHRGIFAPLTFPFWSFGRAGRPRCLGPGFPPRGRYGTRQRHSHRGGDH